MATQSAVSILRRSDIHEEASVKTWSKTSTELPRHPFSIIRGCGAHESYAVAPIHTGGVAVRHVGPRDAT
jgi:hypothetical protein